MQYLNKIIFITAILLSILSNAQDSGLRLRYGGQATPDSLLTSNSSPSWTELAPGIWKTIIGKPEDYDLLKAAGAKPNKEALVKLGANAFPLQQSDIAGFINDGKAYLRFPLEKDEQLYGFGLNFQT